jgi:hypothetical protein
MDKSDNKPQYEAPKAIDLTAMNSADGMPYPLCTNGSGDEGCEAGAAAGDWCSDGAQG